MSQESEEASNTRHGEGMWCRGCLDYNPLLSARKKATNHIVPWHCRQPRLVTRAPGQSRCRLLSALSRDTGQAMTGHIHDLFLQQMLRFSPACLSA